MDGAGPGTIRAVIDNPLPYPRDERHPKFLELAGLVHAWITRSLVPPEPAPQPAAGPGRLPIRSIPAVSLSRTVGLLEVLENEGGMDLLDPEERVDLDLTQLLLVVKAAELLHWVTTPEARVELTPEGRAFLGADIDERKRMVNAMLRRIFVFDLVVQGLQRSPKGELDEDVVLGQIAMTFPHERPQRILRTIISWARYGELFHDNAPRRVFHRLQGR